MTRSPSSARSAKRSKARRRQCAARHSTSLAILARVRDGLVVVRAMAARFAALHAIDATDAAAFGNIGLVEAAQSFRTSAGVPFRAWAAIRVRGAILDGLRTTGRLPQSTCRRGTPTERAARAARHFAGMATAIEMGLVAPNGAEPRDVRTPSPERALLVAEHQRALRHAMARLSPTERAIVEEIYFAERSLTDASRSVGLSKSWASRIHARALRSLRRELTRFDAGAARPCARAA